jgi:site-specific recombinase XerD
VAQDLVVINVGGIDRTGSGVALPAILTADLGTAERVLDFFTANIRNPNTRKAYARAVASFATWCERHGITELRAVRPTHIATYIEGLQATLAAPSIKLQLAAVRMLFDWLVVGQIVPTNPASAVRGPRHVVRKGKTPVLSAEETRELLDSIDTDTPAGLRDRALIALLVYTFARVGAAVKMRLEDVYPQGKRTWVRLHEKGGKRHDMPCHHALDGYLEAFLEHRSADRKAWLFPSLAGRTGKFTDQPMKPVDVWRMIRRRALAAGIPTAIGCHTFRATGITEYLRNGGKLEIAQQMANHESARTTGLYDRRNDQVSLDEVERILI